MSGGSHEAEDAFSVGLYMAGLPVFILFRIFLSSIATPEMLSHPHGSSGAKKMVKASKSPPEIDC